METLFNIIADNLWILLLIACFLLVRHHRILGIILLMSQAVFGFVAWIIIAAVVIAVLLEIAAYCESNNKPK